MSSDQSFELTSTDRGTLSDLRYDTFNLDTGTFMMESHNLLSLVNPHWATLFKSILAQNHVITFERKDTN